jgi:hypothetical protein
MAPGGLSGHSSTQTIKATLLFELEFEDYLGHEYIEIIARGNERVAEARRRLMPTHPGQ